MTFRSRMLAAFLIAVVVPLILLAMFVRNEMTGRLTAQYERRVESLVGVIEADLEAESETIAASLAVLRSAAVDDNRFRRAALGGDREQRRYMLDYAGNAMRLTGLTMLQIQDQSGRIISSGHFRNEYDRLEPRLPALLSSAPGGTALVPARAPDEPFLALARVDSFQMGGTRFWIVAGIRVERSFLDRLQRGSDLAVELVHPGGVLTSESRDETFGDSAIVRELTVPFADPSVDTLSVAAIRVTHRLDDLRSLRRSVDRWFLVAVAAAVVLAVLLAGWLASRISRPLVALAEKTSRIDLDRLDVDFETERRDEVGALSRLLGAMTDRLRVSAARIKDAERRATVGELARQVNHDIKNGLTPIRNVFRHLVQLAGESPHEMPAVFEERRGTLDSSITYLEDLASNYARLYPRGRRQPCDLNEIVERVVTDLRGRGHAAILRARLSGKPIVAGDPLSIRRVLENLVNNAIDSLGAGGGEVSVSTEVVDGPSNRRAKVVVTDSGIGMNEQQRQRIFDDFYSTKEGGTGLGLTIVRRLVMDLDGTVEVESEPGRGSCFIVHFPLADPKRESS